MYVWSLKLSNCEAHPVKNLPAEESGQLNINHLQNLIEKKYGEQEMLSKLKNKSVAFQRKRSV